MATPLVAGCVALIREALQEQGKQRPSAALVKALLVNGAVNYSSPNVSGFDYEQGFGRVDIDSSIGMIKQSAFIDGGNNFEATALDVPPLREMPVTGRQWSCPEIPLPSGRNRLVVTLAYPDESGALLQNDVNLIVRAGEVERHGNMGSDIDFDRINNVEKVIWVDVPATMVTVIVRSNGFAKLSTEQSFAVAWDFRRLE